MSLPLYTRVTSSLIYYQQIILKFNAVQSELPTGLLNRLWISNRYPAAYYHIRTTVLNCSVIVIDLWGSSTGC